MPIKLTQHSELMIRQRVEKLEAVTGLETANRYTVMTAQGDELLHAQEESGTFSRMLLKRHRPLTLRVTDSDKNEVPGRQPSLLLVPLPSPRKRPSQAETSATLRRRISFPARKLTIEGQGGLQIAEIRGPMLKPKTFTVYKQEREVARITKQWSGMMKEAFTDADTFKLELSDSGMDRGVRPADAGLCLRDRPGLLRVQADRRASRPGQRLIAAK